MRSVRDDEYLDVIEKSASGPEAVAPVSSNLIERLANRDSAALKLDMHERQPVHKNGNVIPASPGLSNLPRLVLVDHLQIIVVDILLVDEPYVLYRAVVAGERLNVVLLYLARLLKRKLPFVGDVLGEKALPFALGKCDMVERLQPAAQIGDKIFLGMDLEILIPLLRQKRDKALLKLSLAFVCERIALLRLVTADNGILVGQGNG